MIQKYLKCIHYIQLDFVILDLINHKMNKHKQINAHEASAK